MDLLTIKDIISQAFSKSGYSISNFAISFSNNTSILITKKDDGININFLDNLPVVKTKKFFLPIKTEVQGICLSNDYGTIKLKNFPDMKFYYSEQNEEQVFGNSGLVFDTEKLKNDIAKKYPDTKRKKIAELVLDYATEWAVLANSHGVDFKQCDTYSQKKLYKDCYKFVHDNIINSKKIETKSSSIGLMLLYLFLPAMINWIVKKFIDQLIKRPSLYFTA